MSLSTRYGVRQRGPKATLTMIFTSYHVAIHETLGRPDVTVFRLRRLSLRGRCDPLPRGCLIPIRAAPPMIARTPGTPRLVAFDRTGDEITLDEVERIAI